MPTKVNVKPIVKPMVDAPRGDMNMAEPETTQIETSKPKTKGVKAVATSARASAERAVETAGQTFDNRPFSAIGGALAIGAVVAALLPPTKQEEAIVGPIGDRIRASLDDALQAAREAGTGELTAAGLTFAAATNGLGGVVGSLAKAALSASGAAAASVRKPRQIASDDGAIEPAPANDVENETVTRTAG